MQYEIVVKTSRGERLLKDNRSVVPPAYGHMKYTLVSSENERHTVSPNRRFAQDLADAFVYWQQLSGVSEVRSVKLRKYVPPDNSCPGCEIGSGYCPRCGLSDGTR